MNGLERFIGEVLDEKYRLERLLGQGGMGAVFLATHLGTERPVALKIITPQLMRNEELVARFKREARAAGRLRHPNVVDVTDFGFAAAGGDRVAYLVMEYLDGCTLGEVLAEESRLPLDWVVDILEQVCSAVDEAHRQGIVHRDLKPDNIWLEPNRLGGYRVKVLDFGIAKLADVAASTDAAAVRVGGAQSFIPASGSAPPQPSVAAAPMSSRAANQSSLPHVQSTDKATLEAATLLQHDTATDDALPTRLFAANESNEASSTGDAEAGTRLFDSADEGEPARAHGRTTAPKPAAQLTAPASGLTRVGAIMGTPLYMSPEQCQGQSLDARSDIYSLGVITYQMLTGETPFQGELMRVMLQHREAAPPPVREKNHQVPRRVAQLIESALAKNPDERPARAAGFASALRAHSEGAGKLLQRAFTLYSERFPTFFRISALAYLPLLVITVMQIVFNSLNERGVLPKPLAITLMIILVLLSVIANFLAPSIISGLTALLVTQWFVAPLSPVNLRSALAVLKKKWWPFFTTGISVIALFLIGMILIIPGLYVLVRYSLYAPIVLMEGLKNRAAFRRSNELTLRARRTVWAIVLIHVSIPFLVGALVGGTHAMTEKVGELRVSIQFVELAQVLLNVVLTPLLSITTALLYLKMRQAGGESLEGTSTQLAARDAPTSRWQQRMRERLTVNSGHHSRLD